MKKQRRMFCNNAEIVQNAPCGVKIFSGLYHYIYF